MRQHLSICNQKHSPKKFLTLLFTLALISIATVGCDEETVRETEITTYPSPQSEPEYSPPPSVEPIDPFYGERRGGIYGN